MVKKMASYSNLNEYFTRAVSAYSNRTAIETVYKDSREQLTYGELFERAVRTAYWASLEGIKKSDKVIVILENRPEWPVVFFALSYIGAITIPIDAKLPEKEIAMIVANAEAEYAFISKDYSALSEFLKNIRQLKKVITIPFQREAKSLEAFSPSEVEPEDLSLILYTSGTIDLPKGVMLTHKNLTTNFNSLNQLGLFSKTDSILSILPLYHAYPFMTTLLVPIFSGAKVIYVPDDWPDKLMDYMKEASITIFIGVPQIFHMMHSRIMKKIGNLPLLARLYIKFAIFFGMQRVLLPGFSKAFGKRLRFFVSGGAKLDKIVAEDFFRLGFKILEGYGLTETSPVVTLNPLNKPRIGSIGKCIPDVQVKIINKDADNIGEIAIKGPNVMKGYYKDEIKTKNAFIYDWFLSGDMGYIDRDGYIYITGRSKEIIVLSSGKNIYPEEIEKHYSMSPYVKEICVLGVLKQKGRGNVEYLHAVVVPNLLFFQERGEMNIREVIRNNFENFSVGLPPYKRIMGFTITRENLPRTTLGKMKRYGVEKKYLPIILDEQKKEEALSDDDKILMGSDIAKGVISCIKESLDIKTDVRLNDSIELDLGVDSLGRVELLCAIEKYFNIEVEEEMAASAIFSVKDLVLRVEEIIKKSRGYKNVSGAEPVSWHNILTQDLAADLVRKILLYPSWLDYVFTFFVRIILYSFFKLCYRFSIEGLSRLPAKGPYILYVNHTSFFDGFIVAGSLPSRIGVNLFFIGFRHYFIVPVIRNLVKKARIIPIDATQIIEAMRVSYYILRHNKILCIFPEGGRSIDGQIKEFKKGVGVISRELNIPLVPVFIEGAFEAWPRTEVFPKFRRIKIRFGKAKTSDMLVEEGIVLGAKDDVEAIAMALRQELISLI